MSYQNRGPGRSYGHRPQFQRGPQRSSINRSSYVNAALEPTQLEVQVIENKFSDFGLDAQLLNNLLSHGYETPTPIQDKAIPALMAGNDVVGIANTGTGKTAAFLLPMIHKVINDQDQGVLILAPTRELALQIVEEFKSFAKNVPVSVALCIGGMSIGSQVARLRSNPHFVIGTPGRIIDLMERGDFRIEMFTNIVLDEVDRMLDIGFRKDIKYLISRLPEKRHSAFFSATINRETEDIMRTFLQNPVKITAKSQETSHHIEQDIVPVRNGENKVDVLHDLLIKDGFTKVIVFGRTKHGINKLEQQLTDRGFHVSSIHGNKSQNARQRSLQDFKNGRVQALLATDIAARGIDVEGVTHVINFDEPQSYDDYVHRIGRTGRAGKLGVALTFVS